VALGGLATHPPRSRDGRAAPAGDPRRPRSLAAEAIDAEFERWELSPKEREIALLLLKGYGLKEIAELHARSERTVRQQAGSIYKKAGLAGRAELSAYFLEDLLLPQAQAPAPERPSEAALSRS
jgi:DNA-binding CsgD family transcriptional regulator